MENIKVLIELGLSESEATTYLALLKLGGSLASTVAKEIGIKRTTIYAILKTLASKGFVLIYFRKNKRFYYAQKPKKLSGLFEQKIEAFQNIVPLLNNIEKKQGEVFGLRYIETKKELEQFYLEILEEYKNKEYCIIGDTSSWENVIKDFFEEFRNKRAKLNIKTRLLLSSNSIGINPAEKTLLREFKYLPEKYKFKSTIDIFKDKILIVSPEITSLAIVIVAPAMVDVFKSIFEILWDNN